MELRLAHGRENPAEEMDGWDFDGPKLLGVESMQQMYGETYTVRFLDAETAADARCVTGWPEWHEETLEMLRYNDLIVTHEPGRSKRYYGDLLLFQRSAISIIDIAQRQMKRASRAFDDALRALPKS